MPYNLVELLVMKPVSLLPLHTLKSKASPISMITCYDYPSALIAEACGIDCVLVGDSLGTNMLGYSSEQEVTLADMCHHTRAVSRGMTHTPIIADLPYNTYSSVTQLLDSSQLLLNAGAIAVKFEGYFPDYVCALSSKNIPVVTHLGLTPQTHTKKSLQAATLESGLLLLDQAKNLESAGAGLLILELVPEEIAQLISTTLSIPVIGIGAGRFCDGQVQIWHDVVGLCNKTFKHATPYASSSETLSSAISRYISAIKTHDLLSEDHSFHLSASDQEKLQNLS